MTSVVTTSLPHPCGTSESEVMNLHVPHPFVRATIISVCFWSMSAISAFLLWIIRVILSSTVLPFVGKLYRPTMDRAARIVSFVISKSADACGKSCSGIYWSAE